MEIKTEEAYLLALKRLKNVFTLAQKTQDFSFFYTLSQSISEYENRILFLDEPLDPIDILKMKMEEIEMSSYDLSKVYGTQQMVEDVLNRKRSLSVNMIKEYGAVLKIPSHALIQSYYYPVAS